MNSTMATNCTSQLCQAVLVAAAPAEKQRQQTSVHMAFQKLPFIFSNGRIPAAAIGFASVLGCSATKLELDQD